MAIEPSAFGNRIHFWKDQPPAPATLAVPHALNLAGEQSDAKRLALADGLKKAGASAAVITLSDSVCWLLNIRGHDVPHTPFTQGDHKDHQRAEEQH